MARYIDADEAYEIGKKMRRNGENNVTDLSSVRAVLEATPTADVVEVVRCKDCKHFMEYNEDYVREVEKSDGDCFIRKMYSCDTQFCAVQSDDFCSYGKRKEE